MPSAPTTSPDLADPDLPVDPCPALTDTELADTELADVPVRRGGRVGVLHGAPHRHPAVVERPDALDPSRARDPHLALDAGRHVCHGAPPARVEPIEALTALWTAYPRPAPTAAPARLPSFVPRGFRRVGMVGSPG